MDQVGTLSGRAVLREISPQHPLAFKINDDDKGYCTVKIPLPKGFPHTVSGLED